MSTTTSSPEVTMSNENDDAPTKKKLFLRTVGAAFFATLAAVRNFLWSVAKGCFAQDKNHKAYRMANTGTYTLVAGWVSLIACIVFKVAPVFGLWLIGTLAIIQLSVGTLIAYFVGQGWITQETQETNDGDPG